MPEKSFKEQDIVQLLSKLREETPEYPSSLVKARKESFLKKVLDISASGEGQDEGDSGKHGGGEGQKGGSGGAGGPGISHFSF